MCDGGNIVHPEGPAPPLKYTLKIGGSEIRIAMEWTVLQAGNPETEVWPLNYLLYKAGLTRDVCYLFRRTPEPMVYIASEANGPGPSSMRCLGPHYCEPGFTLFWECCNQRGTCGFKPEGEIVIVRKGISKVDRDLFSTERR